MSEQNLLTSNATFTHYNTPAPKDTRILPLFSLKGRTAAISGAGAGIGLGVAQAYAEAGANVIIWYLTNEAAHEEAAKIEAEYNVKCKAYKVDVTDLSAVESTLASNVAEFNNRLDVFVANAGIPWIQGPMLTGDPAHYHKVVSIDLDGVFNCARAAGKYFESQAANPPSNYRHGSFIATASMSGHIVNIPQLQAAYNAAKAGVKHFCSSLAVEWVRFARVNTISPGYIATAISDFVPTETKNLWRDKIPMGREGQVSELSGAFLYLASDASTYTTGADILVDGGYCVA